MPRRKVWLALLVVLSLFTMAITLRNAQATSPPIVANKAKADAAQKAYGLAKAQVDAGTGAVEAVYLWSRRWADAEPATGKTEHFKRMQALESTVKAKVGAGMLGAIELHAVAYYLAEAQSP